MTKVRLAKALGTLLLLFAAAYGPAFLTVVLLKLRPFEAVPVIIVISLAAAILLIGVESWRAGGFAQFGFRFCHYRYIVTPIVFGVPIAWALIILVNHLSSDPPPPEVSFGPWMTFLSAVSGNAFVFRYFAFLCGDNRCPFVRADPPEDKSDNSGGGLRARTLFGGTQTQKR